MELSGRLVSVDDNPDSELLEQMLSGGDIHPLSCNESPEIPKMPCGSSLDVD